MEEKELIGIAAWNAKLLPKMKSMISVKQTRNGLAPVVLFNQRAENALEFLELFEHTKYQAILSRLARQKSIHEAGFRNLSTMPWYKSIFMDGRKLRDLAVRLDEINVAMMLVVDCLPDDIENLIGGFVEEQPTESEATQKEQLQDQGTPTATETADSGPSQSL